MDVLWILFLIIFLIRCQYKFRRVIPLNISNGVETADVFLNIDTLSLHEKGRLRSDCNDVKFTMAGTEVGLPYFLERGCGTRNTSIWIRFDNLNSTITYFEMFYGNEYYNLDNKRNSVTTQATKFYHLFNGNCHSKLEDSSTGGGYFLYHSNSSILSTGGTLKHKHDISGRLLSSSDYSQISSTVGSDLYPKRTHIHEVEFETEETEALPEYYTLRLCSVAYETMKKWKIEDSIIQNNTVVLLNSTAHFSTFPKRVVDFSVMNSGKLYVRFGSNPGSTGGVSSHSHTYKEYQSKTTLSYYSSTGYDFKTKEVSAFSHKHTISSSSVTSSPYHNPLSITTIFGLTVKPLETINPGTIIISDVSGPLPGFRSLSDSLPQNKGYFIRAGSSYLSISGSEFHDHPTITGAISSSPTDSTSHFSGSGSGEYISNPSHTHTILANVTLSKNLPPYLILHLFEKTATSSRVSIGIPGPPTEMFWSCFNEMRNSSSSCFSKGTCVSPNQCMCTTEGYMGINCDEYVGGAAIWDREKSKVFVEYVVDVTRIESRKKDKGQVMDGKFPCSYMILTSSLSNLPDSDKNKNDIECSWETQSLVRTKYLVIHVTPPEKEDRKKGDNGEYVIKVLSITMEQQSVRDVLVGLNVEDGVSSNYYFFFLFFLSVFFVVPCATMVCVMCIICCIFICCCFYLTHCCCCCLSLIFLRQRSLRKLSMLDDVDLIIMEQEKDKDTSIAHLRINQKLFEVQFDDIKIGSKLGEGGSNSIIFKCEWLGRIVAFKCFRSYDICSEEENFNDFQREVEIMGSISHPNILGFFGACINPPRVGIIIEYCENKDTKNYVLDEKESLSKGMEVFKKKEKMRLMIEVCMGMSYLHDNQIMHRDLKWENVLLSKSFEAKIMDFGLSKVVQNIHSAKQTKRVGTSFYMSPEVAKGDNYTNKCDVFSFGIMIHEMVNENFDPYNFIHKSKYNIEFKVASSPDFRPIIEEDSFEGLKFLIPIAKMCWDHDPDKRPSFEELIDTLSEEGNAVAPSVPKRNYKKDGNLILLENLKTENEKLVKESEVLEKETKQWKKVYERYDKEYMKLKPPPKKMGFRQRMSKRFAAPLNFGKTPSRRPSRAPPPPPPGRRFKNEIQKDDPDELYLY